MFRLFLLLTVFVAPFAEATAQQSQVYCDKARAYTRGLELFDENNFLAAREKFEEIYRQPKGALDHDNLVLMQNLEYYRAVCAIMNDDKDAEKLIEAYFKNYQASDKRQVLCFYAGSYYYRHKSYTEAINFFEKADETKLNNTQLYDYKFQLGYAYFTRKKFAEAKPLFSAIKTIEDKYYYPANYYYAFICFYTKDYDEALAAFSTIEDSKMYASVIPYYIAQIYFYKKEYTKLIAYLERNSSKNGVLYQPEMKFLLGQAYFQQSDYAKALPLLSAFIAADKNVSKEQVYQLAYCQYRTGAYEEAIRHFQQLSYLEDTLAQNAAYALADCYLKSGHKEKARAAFQSAAAGAFDKTIQENALFNYGKLSFELGYSSEAIKSFESYLSSYPQGTYADEVSELLATALVQTHNYEMAYQLMEKMKLSSAMIQEAYQKVTYFRAVELFNDGKTEEAGELCDKSLRYPLDLTIQALATYLKGELFYGANRFAQAAEQYRKFSVLATPQLAQQGEASKFRASYNLAYCYFKQKDYTNATIYFSYAAEEAATTADAKGKQALLPDLYMRLGDCAFVTKNYPKAISAYTAIVSNAWTGKDYAQYQKGIILGLQNKDEEKIAAMHYLITQFKGSNFADHAYYEIGETNLGNGNMSAARTAYQSIINLFPSSSLLPKSYLKIAVIDYNSGKKEAALQDYQEVVKRFPKSGEEHEALAALKEIYIEVGRADEYVDFVQNTVHITINSAEQDSMTYASALTAYRNGDCIKAVALFRGYIAKFPNGIFSNDSHWKNYECLSKAKDFATAIADLEALIENRYNPYYEDALLKASGIAFYELKDYAKALTYYRMLYVASSSQVNTYTSLTGMFHCAVLLQDKEKIVELADQLLNSGVAKEADIQEAYYEKGKAYYAMGNKSSSLAAFRRVTEYPVSERCVEAKYWVAKMAYEKQQYQESLDTCFVLKNKYASYEYWVVKTFILMADNYYAQGNAFQAKATLESIVNNYNGDQALLAEAKEKLEKIRTEELSKAKFLQQAPAPQDSLIMESDSLLNAPK